jgi:glutamyl-tRNA synthetase
MPLLRNVDKSKISKRKNPAARLTWFQEQGYLPEALLNFLGLLGYSLPGGEEVFDFARMSETFDWSRVNTVGPVFDLDKLAWLNGHYVRELTEQEFADRALPFLQREGLVSPQATDAERAAVAALVPAVQTRVNLLSELPELVRFLFVPEEEFSVEPAAAAKALTPANAAVLTAAADALEGVTGWTAPAVQAAVVGALLEGGLGLKRNKAYLPLRAAVCGRAVAPPLDESIALLGRERTLRRLRAAAEQAAASGGSTSPDPDVR